jgi:RNA polymerase sigma factor (sigma-70 family)
MTRRAAALKENQEKIASIIRTDEYLSHSRYSIFHQSEPIPAKLFPDLDRVRGQGHGGRDCPRTSEDDPRPPWQQRVRFLTPAEERDLIEKMRAGDRKARSDLIAAHWPLCAKAAGKYRAGLDLEAAQSAAVVGLMAAADSGNFDPAIARFSTYAEQWMKGEILKAARAARTVVAYPRGSKKPEFELSFDAPLGKPGDGDNFSLHDIISEDDAGDALEQEIAGQAEVLALDALTDRERRIYEARHLVETPLTLQQIGVELGLSNERVRQIETIAERKVAAATDIPRAEREWFQPKPASQNGPDHRTPERRQRALEDRGFSPELAAFFVKRSRLSARDYARRTRWTIPTREMFDALEQDNRFLFRGQAKRNADPLKVVDVLAYGQPRHPQTPNSGQDVQSTAPSVWRKLVGDAPRRRRGSWGSRHDYDNIPRPKNVIRRDGVLAWRNFKPPRISGCLKPEKLIDDDRFFFENLHVAPEGITHLGSIVPWRTPCVVEVFA